MEHFSKEQNIPIRSFVGDETKKSSGLNGPGALATDIDAIIKMFNPSDLFEFKNDAGEIEQCPGGIGEKNLQNGCISYQKLSDALKMMLSNFASKEALDTLQIQLGKKADSATTLSGYGINDSYTAEEIDGAFRSLAESMIQHEQQMLSKFAECLSETVLYEEVVDTPIWTNQPTYEGTLDFDISDYYYVTLKDTDGTALDAGQFKLMPLYDKYAEAYETVFTLQDYDTGNAGILSENVPVEFTEDYKLRNAGVSMVTVALDKNLNTDIKTIRTTANGRFIKARNGDYFAIYYLTDKNVSNYHSATTTTWNSDSGKYIWQYANFGSDAYKEGKFSDELILTKLSATEFNAYRNTLLRCLPWGKTEYIHYPKNNVGSSVGFGSILEDNTTLRQVSVAAINGRGYFRNGTVIRVTEVK